MRPQGCPRRHAHCAVLLAALAAAAMLAGGRPAASQAPDPEYSVSATAMCSLDIADGLVRWGGWCVASGAGFAHRGSRPRRTLAVCAGCSRGVHSA